MSFFVYIVEAKNGHYYVGYTNDLKSRMEKHQSGKGSKYLRAFGFKKLVYVEAISSKSDAMKREIEIKKLDRQQREDLILSSKNL